jgi:hypothetical protein
LLKIETHLNIKGKRHRIDEAKDEFEKIAVLAGTSNLELSELLKKN